MAPSSVSRWSAVGSLLLVISMVTMASSSYRGKPTVLIQVHVQGGVPLIKWCPCIVQ